MKIRFLLITFLLLGYFTLFASDQPKTVIKIMVTNQFDKPVENAEVILDFLGLAANYESGLTKENTLGSAHQPTGHCALSGRSGRGGSAASKQEGLSDLRGQG